jgi:hypothetical protein
MWEGVETHSRSQNWTGLKLRWRWGSRKYRSRLVDAARSRPGAGGGRMTAISVLMTRRRSRQRPFSRGRAACLAYARHDAGRGTEMRAQARLGQQARQQVREGVGFRRTRVVAWRRRGDWDQPFGRDHDAGLQCGTAAGRLGDEPCSGTFSWPRADCARRDEADG